MSRYWISWYEPTPDETEDYRPLVVPTADDGVVGWWCSGHVIDGSAATLCAVIEASSQADAEAVVARFWRPDGWRFCEGVPSGWMPDNGRFPVMA